MTSKSTPTLSVVVVTYLRTKGLASCLAALAQQSLLPVEVIVIDNGVAFGEEARQVCEAITSDLPIRYFGSIENSLPFARNLGVSKCSGDFVALIDDDVRLDKDYLEAALSVFDAYPEAVAVQGYIEPGPRKHWREFLQRFFWFFHYEKDACRVLPSISTTYPAPLTKIISCEWISGSNQVYRRTVLNEIQWDDKLLKYADGEDLDHSFRVYQRYPGRLYITPNAHVIHDESAAGRAVGSELVAMREIYGWYLLHKLFPTSHRALFIYIWSRIGRLLLTLGVALTRRRPRAWDEVSSLLGAYCLVWHHRKEISNGNFDEFNKKYSL